ncbi:MAG: aldolase/citrate lyase family protein [Pseudomonadota bacterium]|nr:aldolase/citrate lyase family protein [Pseudomonadota bacterium]
MAHPRYGDLGASLYVPATHKSLGGILADGCHGARSLILCTEDAVSPDAAVWAVRRLIRTLKAAPSAVPFLRFVRPRNPFVLRQLLEAPKALVRLDGVVIPKFDEVSASEWREVLDRCPTLAVMPTLETPSLFREITALATLEALEKLHNPVITLRIGGNDLLGAIGLKRQPGQTIYDTPLRSTLERLIMLFRPAGFELAAPVCDLIGEPETLSREVAQDIAWGFYAKTCVHPAQLAVVEEHFAQALRRQQPQAQALLNSNDAVFTDAGQMLEQTCHSNWAKRIATLQVTS